jgi:HAD superfamily hydrolase (TIGR01484 family)
MSFKLAVFDVDGTLAEIHRPAKLDVSRKLRDLEKLGAKIVLASGKNVSYLLGFARGIGVKPVFVIAESGCLVFDVEKAELKKMVEMTKEMTIIKNEALEQFSESVWLHPNEVQLTIVPKDHRKIPSVASFVHKAAEPFKDELAVVVHEDAVDVLPAKIDKGKGLLEVLRILGMSKGEVVAVGDSSNDVPLFRNAGQSIIVGNNPVAHHGAKRFSDINEALDYLKDVFGALNMS